MQGPKNLERWEKDWKNQLKLDTQMSNEWTECTSSGETLQWNKICTIKLFSCNIECGSISKQNVT